MAAAPCPRRSLLLASAMVAGLALAAYASLPSNGFLDWDDRVHIVDDPVVAGPLGIETGRSAFSFERHYFQPLTVLSFAVDRALFGLDPRAYHLENLLWHVATAIVLLLVLADLTGQCWRAAAVAALFAVHPVNVESVAWAIERRNVLAAFFGILAVGAHVRWVRRPSAGRHVAVLVLLLLSLLAKLLFLTLPLLLLALDLWPLRRLAGNWRRALVEKLPMTAVCVSLAVVVSASLDRLDTWIERPVGLRAATAVVSFVRHLAHLVAPVRLGPFYPYPEHVSLWQVAGAVIVLAAITAVAIRARGAPYWLAGWAWFVAALLPTLGFRQAGIWPALADRHAYVAAIGPFFAVTWGMADLLGARARVLAGASLVALAALSARQVRFWKDNVSLFGRAVELAPEVAMFRYTLGTALASSTPPRELEAIPHLTAAVRLEPYDAKARANLGRALASVGRLDDARAELEAGLGLAPRDEALGEALGELLLRTERNADAAAVLERTAGLNRANAHSQALLAEALNLTGRFEETVARGEALGAAVRAFPDLRFQLGVAYASIGRVGDAQAEAIALRSVAPELAASLESYVAVVIGQMTDPGRARSDR